MANTIILKKSSVVGKVPTTENLVYGEVALNYSDGKLYFKDSSNNIKSFDVVSTGTTSTFFINNNTESVNTTTGALTILGGVGIKGQLNVGGTTSTFLGKVGIGVTNPTYKLEVNGSFAASSKSFVIPHPTKPGWKLQYGSLESPYHGIRLTGESAVVAGKCKVQLPNYIKALCKKEGVNIQITNIQHGKVLWVDKVDVSKNNFTVKCEVSPEEKKEKTAYKFYWSFSAVRKDVEDLVVELG